MPDTNFDHLAISDNAGTAPFSPGDVVLFRDAPLGGAMVVTKCQFRFGYWTLEWAASGEFGTTPAVGSTPADHMMLCPEGLEFVP